MALQRAATSTTASLNRSDSECTPSTTSACERALRPTAILITVSTRLTAAPISVTRRLAGQLGSRSREFGAVWVMSVKPFAWSASFPPGVSAWRPDALKAGKHQLICIAVIGRPGPPGRQLPVSAAPGRPHGVAYNIGCNKGQFHAVGKRQGRAIDLTAANDHDLAVTGQLQRLLQAGCPLHGFIADPARATDNNIAPLGQRPAYGLERMAAHNNRLAQRNALEVPQVGRQMPGHAALSANDVGARHGGHKSDAGHVNSSGGH